MEGVTASAEPPRPEAPLPQPLRRSRTGAWLGGVCRGMADRWAMPVGQLRALFVATALFAGLGLLAYVACWLVLPAEDDDDSPSLLRGVASLALLAAAAAGLFTLALLACLATLFGFGWAVAVALAVFLAGSLVAWPATRPAWVLLPLAAVALPAVVTAASGVRIAPQGGLVSAAPRTPQEIPAAGYRTGLGELFVDLRGLEARAGTTIPLRLDTGISRTVVALPTDRCFNVEVTYETGSRVLESARGLLDRVRGWMVAPSASSNVYLYGEQQAAKSGTWTRPSRDRGAPTLKVDFRSVGGELWLRDYPVGVGPLYEPGWPYLAYVDRYQPEELLERQERGACAPGTSGTTAAKPSRPARERRPRRPSRARATAPERAPERGAAPREAR